MCVWPVEILKKIVVMRSNEELTHFPLLEVCLIFITFIKKGLIFHKIKYYRRVGKEEKAWCVVTMHLLYNQGARFLNINNR